MAQTPKRLSDEELADYIMLHPEMSEVACILACGWAQGSTRMVLSRVRPIVAARRKKISAQLDQKILKDKTISIEFLDANLCDIIENGEGMARLKAICVGYGRLGISLEPKEAPPQFSPNPIYSWVFQQKQASQTGENGTQPVALEDKSQVELPRPRTRNEQIRIEIEDELLG